MLSSFWLSSRATSTSTASAATLCWPCVVCIQVQAVREVVPGRSNNDIILVLQYYDYSVEQTIQAFLESAYQRIELPGIPRQSFPWTVQAF